MALQLTGCSRRYSQSVSHVLHLWSAGYQHQMRFKWGERLKDVVMVLDIYSWLGPVEIPSTLSDCCIHGHNVQAAASSRQVVTSQQQHEHAKRTCIIMPHPTPHLPYDSMGPKNSPKPWTSCSTTVRDEITRCVLLSHGRHHTPPNAPFSGEAGYCSTI
jgi:hypothetical protein